MRSFGLALAVASCAAARAMTAAPIAGSLDAWHAAVARVPTERVLPLGLGGTSQEPATAAFYGDAVLSAAVAREQRAQYGLDAASLLQLSSILSEATSNRLFAERLRQILPQQAAGLDGAITRRQDHDAGTMVEAAVDAVASAGDVAAVDTLAAWLVAVAARSAPTLLSKGTLLERGGKVHVEREAGTPDHAPVYVATAVLGERRATASAASKKDAEKGAAARLLAEDGDGVAQSLGELDAPTARTSLLDAPRGASPAGGGRMRASQASGLWRSDALTTRDVAANLQDGESLVEWWRRGACVSRKAYHRALMSAHVFPESIASVDCWTRVDPHPGDQEGEDEPRVSALFALVAAPGVDLPRGAGRVLSEACSGPSKQRARRAAAVRINRYVAEHLIGEPLPEADG